MFIVGRNLHNDVSLWYDFMNLPDRFANTSPQQFAAMLAKVWPHDWLFHNFRTAIDGRIEDYLRNVYRINIDIDTLCLPAEGLCIEREEYDGLGFIVTADYIRPIVECLFPEKDVDDILDDIAQDEFIGLYQTMENVL